MHVPILCNTNRTFSDDINFVIAISIALYSFTIMFGSSTSWTSLTWYTSCFLELFVVIFSLISVKLSSLLLGFAAITCSGPVMLVVFTIFGVVSEN